MDQQQRLFYGTGTLPVTQLTRHCSEGKIIVHWLQGKHYFLSKCASSYNAYLVLAEITMCRIVYSRLWSVCQEHFWKAETWFVHWNTVLVTVADCCVSFCICSDWFYPCKRAYVKFKIKNFSSIKMLLHMTTWPSCVKALKANWYVCVKVDKMSRWRLIDIVIMYKNWCLLTSLSIR